MAMLGSNLTTHDPQGCMVPFNDLKPLMSRHRDALEVGVRRVLERAWFILGPEVEAFEAEFAAYHGSQHRAVAVGHGTDAIELGLRAAGIGPGDEVITTPLTAVPTVAAIERTGATPVFADIDADSCNIDPAAVRAAITPRTRAIVPVHLYGRPADMPALLDIARPARLFVLEDCAQAHGARIDGQLAGTFGDLAAYSFYPTKNLGACGDGGAILTADSALAERVRLLRNYGQAARYEHVAKGGNSRLDEIQAALLRVMLPHLDAHNDQRRRLALRYLAALPQDVIQQHREGEAPAEPRTRLNLAASRLGRSLALPAGTTSSRGLALHHVYHLFVIRSPERDALAQLLAARGVQTLIHYPRPVHLQPAYADLGYARGSLPIAERVASKVLSLPLFIGMTDAQVDEVCKAIAGCRREAA